ncbi:MAG: hypothetical protein ACPG8F_08405 [Flavobacteriaceae bacterium]
MKYLHAFRALYRKHYLLAATASIIIIGFFGSLNVLLITMHKMNFGWMFVLFLTVMATMRFLAFFLAQFPVARVFEAALSGVLIQIILFVLIASNFFSFLS